MSESERDTFELRADRTGVSIKAKGKGALILAAGAVVIAAGLIFKGDKKIIEQGTLLTNRGLKMIKDTKM